MAKEAKTVTISNTPDNTGSINSNFAAVNEALQNTISRDGSTPNAMEADLDLNSNDILNAETVWTEQLYLGNREVSVTGLTEVAELFVNVTALLADTRTSYPTGTILRTQAEGFAYEVADPSATDQDALTAGGVKLYRQERFTIATGTGEAATTDYEAATSGFWFNVSFPENSEDDITLNGFPIRILDVYATEESQWTIGSGAASKDQPKTEVFRNISRGMISTDVRYPVRWRSDLSFFEIRISKLYKHVFIKTGSGAEIPELQDVFSFISQFDRGTAMDPEFLRSDASTDYYPNKAQVSITLPAGPDTLNPVTSTFTKRVRIGENDLGGVEIVNETRYAANLPAGTCIAEFTGALETDDLAFINVWKTGDFGEIRGIRFVYSGVFETNQSVIRYNRSYARLKNCEVDVSGASISGGATNVSAVYWDTGSECFGNTVICDAVTQQDLAAYSILADSVSPTLLTEGKPKWMFRTRGLVLLSSPQAVSGDPEYLVDAGGPSNISITGTSTNITNVQNAADTNGFPVVFTLAGNLVNTGPLTGYEAGTVSFGEEYSIVSEVFSLDAPSAGTKLLFKNNQVVSGGVGQFGSLTGVEFSGDGSTRHWKVESGGDMVPGATLTYNLGSGGRIMNEVWTETVYHASGVFDTIGTGSPEGAIAAGVGSTYRDTAGGAGAVFYVKETGNGVTGWVAK